MNVFPWLAAATALALPASAARDTAPACQAKIGQVREASGLAKLDEAETGQGQALLIKAVDKRIEGCRVLTMARDTRDVRPEPPPADGRALFRRIR